MDNVEVEISTRLVPVLAKGFENKAGVGFARHIGKAETQHPLPLSWFFWLMSVNPDVERKILKELETIRSSNGKNLGGTYSFEELRDMHYLQAAISETMRLYPPVPVDTKACKSDDVLPDGTFVGKNWQESPFKFPVFNAGPRMCLGKDMAYIQMKSIAASVIERFEIAVQNKEQCPEHLLSLTLRMKGGLQVKAYGRLVLRSIALAA
ncbi:hypothetical protein OIU76_021476 [Salix suchowensis]|nr:hypothetical protein OIU76_021476 [Salix suchowensis]